ncbi:hypothetical protein [Streptomyces candidus]|uniref:Uncharacterized protein n=1 Tax=Streptomyces candidus TaxID=67283 RepID=A0A7X0HCY4_9ACTN|nr:hypothetical protein [Streptomyces candidus]MBB6435279.1 hypothetical protein [Streptomyces candidus]
MSLKDELTDLQQCLDRLDRTVLRVAAEVGDSLEIRRIRTDAAHLRESVALLGAPTPAAGAGGPPRVELITIPDAPYDSALWTDSDDEGLGARDRHAP